MSKSSVSSAVVETPTVTEPERKSKTYTKWDIFDKAKLGVTQVKCWVLPGHSNDEACKTAFPPTAEGIIAHLGHGGGFLITVHEAETPWDGWKKLAKAGVEIQFLRDEVTDHHMTLSVRELKARMKPHKGKFRGAYQAFKNQFLFSLDTTAPTAAGDDYDDPEQSFD